MDFAEKRKQQQKALMEDLKRKMEIDELRRRQKKFGIDDAVNAYDTTQNLYNAGKNTYNGIKNAQSASNLANSAKQSFLTSGASKPELLSSMGNTANALKDTANTANNVGNALNTTSKIGNTANTASGVASSASNIAGNAGTALSALSAGTNLAKGNYSDAGLDAISTAGAYIPVYGWIVSALAQAVKFAKNFKAKKEQKAIQSSEKATVENEQTSQSNLNDRRLGISEQKTENMQEMQNAIANADTNNNILPLVNTQTNTIDPIGVQNTVNTQPTTAQPVQTQPIEQPIIQQEQSVLVETTPVPEENNLVSAQDNALGQDKASIVSGILNAVKNASSKADTAIDTGKERIGNMVDTAVAKVKPGVRDFMAGYQDNRNTSFTQGDLYNQIKEQEPQTTTDEQGNVVLQGGTEELKKSIMAKLGEMAGTTTRVASNPYIQALIAGGIYKATGGDTGESIKYGVDWAQNKAKSDYYAKALGQQPGILGGVYDADDYNAQVNKYYKDQMIQNTADRIQTMKDNYNNQKQAKDDLLAFQKEKEKNNYNEKVRHNKAMESLGQKKIDKTLKDEETNQALNQDMLDFIDILGSGDEDLIAQAEEDMIGTYGVDVLKQLNLLNEKYFSKKK